MTLWSANVGGYSQQGETQRQAYDRILAGFGDLQVIRWWPSRFFRWSEVPAYYGNRAVCANLGADVLGVNRGVYDTDLADLCRSADRTLMLTFAHEPEEEVFETKVFTLSGWQQAQQRLAGIVKDVGNPLVSFGPLLMGATYHPTRYKGAANGNVTWQTWLNFPMRNLSWLAADLYQWGKDDASADKASTLMSPFLNACTTKRRLPLVGELGARRVYPQFNPGISDAARARFLLDGSALLEDADTVAVMYYETDRGPADKAPWLLLDNATGTGVKSPKAAKVWRDRCTLP